MLKNFSLTAKLVGSFIIVSIITLAVAMTGWWGVSNLGNRVNEIGTVRMPGVQHLLTLDVSIGRLMNSIRSLLNADATVEGRQKELEAVAVARADYKKAWDAYLALPRTDREKEIWSRFEARIGEWKIENDKFFAMAAELSEMDIYNPHALLAQALATTDDHRALLVKSSNLLRFGEQFQGGEDGKSCRLGKFLDQFKTTNSELKGIVDGLEEPHALVHSSVRQIRAAFASADLEKGWDQYRNQLLPSSEKVIAGMQKLLVIAEKALNIRKEMNVQALEKAMEGQKKCLAELSELVHLNLNLAENSVKEGLADAANARNISLGASLGGTVVALLFGVVLSLGLTKTLNNIIAALMRGSDQVSSASGQVSSASQQMAEGASEQASSLEEVSSSLEEMASMTRQNAQNAGQANSMSVNAATAAGKGRDAMARMVEAIDKIKVSSDETAKILKTIDEIAFQTNLLALNAAVEAARAGEAGKGFAVVAEEVRNLAQRSAEAARNTARLVEESQHNSVGGVKASKEVGQILEEIVDGVGKVSQLIAEVSAASSEQSKGIDQVNVAVAQMNGVTQANAANAEESAAASEELSAQAGEMVQMVESLVRVVEGGTDSNGSSGNFARTEERRPAAPAPRAAEVFGSTGRKAGSAARKPSGSTAAAASSRTASTSRIIPRPAPPTVTASSVKASAPQEKVSARNRPEEVFPLDDDDISDF